MEQPKRKLHRLKNWDYSQSGYYFITICTKDKRPLLATVGNAVPGVPSAVPGVPHMIPTEIGKRILYAWAKMSEIDTNIKTDAFCLMPNHIHGIIVIENQSPTKGETERRGRRSLPDIVRGFKSATTREYNRLVPKSCANTLWQSSYYDEIIRNDQMLHEIRQYIDENPLKWREDTLYSPL